MLRMLGDRILVKPEAAPEQTPSGIVLPKNAQSDGSPARGIVTAVGPGVVIQGGTIRPLGVREGETVLYTPMSGFPIKDDGTDYVIINEQSVMAVVGA